ncbi:MAG: 6-bladed beta-propeller [Rikenellaceae bacterium]|jgi:hypothetical protein|nr:6-bladed beta-propeller [Rikenellaceae bacterium]
MLAKTIISGTLLLLGVLGTAQGQGTIRLQARGADKTVNLSEVVALEAYIPLSNEDDALIGEISKMIVTADHFVIRDDVAMSILIFDKRDGSLVRKIDAQGRGPREYVDMEDIAVDRQGNIYLLSRTKFIVYDKLGNFRSEVPNPYLADYIAVLPDGRIALSCENIVNRVGQKKYEAGLLILDRDFQVEKTLFPFEEKNRFSAYTTFNTFVQNNTDLLVHQRYDDNLYRMRSGGQMEVAYRLDYGNNNTRIADRLKKEFVGLGNSQESLTRETQAGYCVLLGLYDLTDALLLLFRCADRYSYAFYDKRSGKLSQYTIRYTGQNFPVPLINDVDSAPYYAFVGAEGNTLYGFAYPDFLLGDVGGANALLNRVGDRLQPDGNLVITQFKLK